MLNLRGATKDGQGHRVYLKQETFQGDSASVENISDFIEDSVTADDNLQKNVVELTLLEALD